MTKFNVAAIYSCYSILQSRHHILLDIYLLNLLIYYRAKITYLGAVFRASDGTAYSEIQLFQHQLLENAARAGNTAPKYIVLARD